MKTDIKPAETVDEYLNRLPSDIHKALQNLRNAIISLAPDAEELISYQMPSYKYHGPLVYFAAFKNHCSFFCGKKIAEEYAAVLPSLKISGGTIQFTPSHPLPESVVKKIVKRRMQENKEKALSKKRK